MSDTNTNEKIALLDKLFQVLPAFLAFLMPVFFLPITLEFFEFNKLTLLVVTTAVMLVAWVVRMIMTKQVSLVRSKLDVAVLGLLVVFILSTVFSLNKTSSIFGSQGRWFPSLFGIVTLVVFYYAVSSNVRRVETARMAIYAFIAGATLSTVVGLLSYFGITLGDASYLQAANFSLTGSTVTTTALAAIAVILSTGLISYTNAAAVKGVLVQAAIINLFAVIVFSTVPSIVILAVGALLLLFFVPLQNFASNKAYLSAIMGAFVISLVVMVLPTTRSAIVNESFPDEISLSAAETWRVSSSTLRDFPLLGTGPSTFYLNYPRYKSLAQNNTDFWNIRFDKAYSEVFSVIGSLGIIGILVVAYWAFRVAKTSLGKEIKQDPTGVSQMLSIGTLMVLVLFGFTYATVLTSFLLWMFLALNVALLQHRNESHVERVILSLASITESMSLIGNTSISTKRETLQYIVSVPMLALVIGGAFLTYKNYAGEYYMRQSLNAAAQNNGSETYRYQTLAIAANPQRDSYHNSLARTDIALANSIATKENITDDDRNTIRQLIAQAIQEVRLTTEVLNPLNPAGWETRAVIYSSLNGVAQNATEWSARAYTNAIQLDSTNPRLRVALGGISYAAGDYLTAANYFRQATSLKPDYANAHYNFAQALIQLQAYADAQRELEIVNRLVPAGSADAEKVAADLLRIQDLVSSVAGAADERPTVEELEGSIGENVTEQEPLTQPGVPLEVEGIEEEVQINEEGQVQQDGNEAGGDDEQSNNENQETNNENN